MTLDQAKRVRLSDTITDWFNKNVDSKEKSSQKPLNCKQKWSEFQTPTLIGDKSCSPAMGQTLGSALAQRTTRWDFLKRPELGFPESTTGPLKPRPPTPGLHLPPGTHIPDWRQYKVENSPELLEVQQRLAARGLKDPWLRNEVWRYDTKMFGTARLKLTRLYAPGILYGLALFGVVMIAEATVFKQPDHHGHGHDHQEVH